MIWPAAVVARFALDAGWAGDDAPVAVAVALAGSGGDDQHCDVVSFVPLVALVGLWLVPSGETPGEPFGGLLRPQANAIEAHRLWTGDGPGWSWNAAWHTGRWLDRVDDARAAVQGPARGAPAGPWFLRPGTSAPMSALTDATDEAGRAALGVSRYMTDGPR